MAGKIYCFPAVCRVKRKYSRHMATEIQYKQKPMNGEFFKLRIRRKPWARPELKECPFCIQNPLDMKNNWKSVFNNQKPVHMELGCGKGGFISEIASQNPDINYFAADIKSEMLALAKRKIESAYNQKNIPIDNVKIMCCNIQMINDIWDENDKIIDRIYINFCNPWPRGKHKKRRLVHTRQLVQYKKFLKDGGEIRFKTDDDELFEESFEYFRESGFTITFSTTDLHNSGFTENIQTEHEQMFTEMGKKIKFLIAVNDGEVTANVKPPQSKPQK